MNFTSPTAPVPNPGMGIAFLQQPNSAIEDSGRTAIYLTYPVIERNTITPIVVGCKGGNWDLDKILMHPQTKEKILGQRSSKNDNGLIYMILLSLSHA